MKTNNGSCPSYLNKECALGKSRGKPIPVLICVFNIFTLHVNQAYLHPLEHIDTLLISQILIKIED